MPITLHCPATAEAVAALRAGDELLLSGTVYTARDAAHRRLCELLDRGETPPFPLAGSAIYYVGPTPARPGDCIGSAGPTTSGRMDAYTPRLLRLGLRVMIGKGERSEEVRRAIVECGAVYLAAPGGAGALLASCVREAETLCWEDLGCEAVRRLRVENLPLTVAIDSRGNDLYRSGPAAWLRANGR